MDVGFRTSLKFLLSLTLILASASASAGRLRDKLEYYPEDFYQKVDNGAVADLKRELFRILSSAHVENPQGHDVLKADCGATDRNCFKHFSLGYRQARTLLFGELHLERHGGTFAIRDVYCQHLSGPSEYKKDPPGPGKIPDPSVLNAEHTWPQSRFNGRFDRDLQKSDLHILYPSLAEANTSRSNHEFNEVGSELDSPCPKNSQRGYATRGNRIYFEPPAPHKGNVARAIFYFSVRYQLQVSAEEEASLRAWHRADPPDSFETTRNETIFSKQKVRNPFIDHPELVDLISDF